MSRFAAGMGRGADWRTALTEALAQDAIAQGANLGFVYFSDLFSADAPELLEALKNDTGIASWVGCSTIGPIGKGKTSMGSPCLSLLTAALPEQSFRVFSGRERLPSASDGYTPYFAVVHADPMTPDMPDLVADMAGKVSSGFLTGGLASSRRRNLHIANDVLFGGISGVAFTSDVGVATRLTQGCAALPGRHVITSCEENVIQRIDQRAALDVYLETVGEDERHDLRAAAQRVLVGLPVAGREAGDYRVRSVIGVDPNQGLLAINEAVEAGQSLLFVRRDTESAYADMQNMLSELKASLPSPPQGAIYVSCNGRGSNMFDADHQEVDMIRDAFGEIPLTGFFANGEISHDQLYGFTGVLTLFL